jgi:hypothetical protein
MPGFALANADKSNEIVAVPKLLELLCLKSMDVLQAYVHNADLLRNRVGAVLP